MAQRHLKAYFMLGSDISKGIPAAGKKDCVFLLEPFATGSAVSQFQPACIHAM